jgi:hypothetical protein
MEDELLGIGNFLHSLSYTCSSQAGELLDLQEAGLSNEVAIYSSHWSLSIPSRRNWANFVAFLVTYTSNIRSEMQRVSHAE